MLTTNPRIYVVCREAKRAGLAHGAWIDAAQSVSAIEQEIQALFDISPVPDAGEYIIEASEGFGQIYINESVPIKTVVDIVKLLRAYGELSMVLTDTLHTIGQVSKQVKVLMKKQK